MNLAFICFAVFLGAINLAACRNVYNQAGTSQMGVPARTSQMSPPLSTSYQQAQPNGQQTTYVQETVVTKTISNPVMPQQAAYNTYNPTFR